MVQEKSKEYLQRYLAEFRALWDVKHAREKELSFKGHAKFVRDMEK